MSNTEKNKNSSNIEPSLSVDIEEKKRTKKKRKQKRKNKLLHSSLTSKTSTINNTPNIITKRKADSSRINPFCPFDHSSEENTSMIYSTDRYDISSFNNNHNKFKQRFINRNSDKMLSNSSINIEKASTEKKSIRKTLTNSNNNKIIKYTTTYLNTIQKSIILFNSKKYSDCYQYLLSHNVIRNENEFAELLLISNGYDKSNIGNFLSKDTYELNKDYKLLNYYIQKIQFTNVPILTSLRFLLSRINLPSDSNLLLKIIEIFSNVFYADNKSYGIYKDSNCVYLLCSVILAVNTLFCRKDINNIKQITKEEFSSMNNDIDKSICDDIYKDLEKNPLNITYEYNEHFNRRLTAISKCDKVERTSTIVLDDITIEETEGKELIEMMKNGDAFIKYGSNNPVIHNKYISLDEKENKFIIKETCFLLCNKIRSININEIVDVYYGMSYSKYNDKYKIKPQTEDCCLSIETKKRIYDLRSKNVTQCTQWYKGIKYLIKKYKTSTNNKNNINSIANNNNQDKISSIWINDIIPNWNYYSNMLLNNAMINKKKKLIDIHYLYRRYGVPKILRKKMWEILIGNEMNIDALLSLSNENEDVINKHINSLYCKVRSYYDLKIEENVFKTSITRLLNGFMCLRKDIPYNKNILYIFAMFIIVNNLESENDTITIFSQFCNFIHYKANFLLKYLKEDESFINSRMTFYDSLLMIKLPKLYNHFSQLEIETKLYFNNWMDSLFVRYFIYEKKMNSINKINNDTIFKIFDNLLIKGEVFLYEIIISILTLLEKKLLNMPIEHILHYLSKYPYEVISENDLFMKLLNVNFQKEYEEMNSKEKKVNETNILLRNTNISFISINA